MKHDSQSQGHYFFNEMKLKLKMHVLGHKQWKRGGKVDYLSRIIVCVKGFHAYKIFHSKPILPLPLKYVTCSSTLNKNKKKKIKESPTSSVIYTKSTDLQKKMNFTITAQLVSATRQHAVSHPS
jgi:hypothetical protein